MQLDSLKLNLNFNELASDDMKHICESVQNAKLISLELLFKGCGLPRNAFRRLCNWLQESVEVAERLSLDFTL